MELEHFDKHFVKNTRKKNPQGNTLGVFSPSSDVSRLFGRKKYPKSTFQVVFFQLFFNEKYVELAINDFPVHLVILKRFSRQKCRQKSKTMRQKDVEVKEETVYEIVFIH